MLEPREHTACCGRLVECLCLHSVDVEAHHGPIRCHGVVVPLHELLGPERRGVNGRRTKKESVAGTAEAIEKVVITRVGENRVDREHIRAGLLPLGPHRQGEAGSEPGDRRVHRVQRSGLAPSDLGVRVEAQRVPVIRRGGWEQPAEGAEHRGPAPRRSRTLLTRRGPSPQSPGRAARSGSRGNPGGVPAQLSCLEKTNATGGGILTLSSFAAGVVNSPHSQATRASTRAAVSSRRRSSARSSARHPTSRRPGAGCSTPGAGRSSMSTTRLRPPRRLAARRRAAAALVGAPRIGRTSRTAPQSATRPRSHPGRARQPSRSILRATAPLAAAGAKAPSTAAMAEREAAARRVEGVGRATRGVV